MDKLGIGNETQYAHTAKAKAKDLGRRANGKDQARKVMKKTPRETAPKVIKQGSTDDPAAPLDEPLDTAQQRMLEEEVMRLMQLSPGEIN